MTLGFELLLTIAFCVMGFVFARNACIGVRQGIVWAKGTRYRRAEHPLYFWISLFISALMAVVCFGLTSVCLLALIFASG